MMRALNLLIIDLRDGLPGQDVSRETISSTPKPFVNVSRGTFFEY